MYIYIVLKVDMPVSDLSSDGPVVGKINDLKDNDFSVDAVTDAPPIINGDVESDVSLDFGYGVESDSIDAGLKKEDAVSCNYILFHLRINFFT